MDSKGRSWRAWDVERVRPRGEDFLEASFRDGWLVFESEDGRERRRLGDYPRRWNEMSPVELERLCASATLATRPGALGRAAETRQHEREGQGDAAAR
ncbi:MAG TPA: hypothetical protein VEA99_03275 [Gemmatimonadaceae bacterium]|nr:hypothetical protein [Gemmatimonadaceae bacterium]